jgi:hypothetical protein
MLATCCLPLCMVHGAGLHYGEVFEQVALLQCRPDIPPDMPADYAGVRTALMRDNLHSRFLLRQLAQPLHAVGRTLFCVC